MWHDRVSHTKRKETNYSITTSHIPTLTFLYFVQDVSTAACSSNACWRKLRVKLKKNSTRWDCSIILVESRFLNFKMQFNVCNRKAASLPDCWWWSSRFQSLHIQDHPKRTLWKLYWHPKFYLLTYRTCSKNRSTTCNNYLGRQCV